MRSCSTSSMSVRSPSPPRRGAFCVHRRSGPPPPRDERFAGISSAGPMPSSGGDVARGRPVRSCGRWSHAARCGRWSSTRARSDGRRSIARCRTGCLRGKRALDLALFVFSLDLSKGTSCGLSLDDARGLLEYWHRAAQRMARPCELRNRDTSAERGRAHRPAPRPAPGWLPGASARHRRRRCARAAATRAPCRSPGWNRRS